MARRGMRVLALAFRDCESNVTESDVPHQSREWAESHLTFAGFAVYQCLGAYDAIE
jgi:cation-transporting ATPase 13A1